eukprot:TRINITY_DN3137_c0_g1_i1.p1 TRINITY_DN3137_c0_g1~~TRINITY_DN3137_c0_g1_i1.p1  ORF type:complete len:210 (-),score=45.20 TRINITY_DN3137_c0_g1_i1:132-728(-)
MSQSIPFVGEAAPAFTVDAVIGEDIKKISLSDYKGKWVVLFFYPLDWTFVCPTEIVAFSDAAKKFRDLGAEILAASVDSVFSHIQWVRTSRAEGGIGKVDFPLIADLDKSLSRSYGALYKNTGHTLRALYIIGPEGNIRHITMNDPPVGRNVDEVLRILQGYQFTDEHGEVCPANWRPGSDTIIPNPNDKVKYFNKHG